MHFDIDVATGHWPFRQVPNQDIAGLKRLLKSKGVTGAAVVNTNGLFYKNCHDANIELAKTVARHTDFFTAVATLNPCYPACERDLVECVDKLDMRALRLVPQYHDYQLGNPQTLVIMKKAAELELPVFIPKRIVDPRGRHWMDTGRMIYIREIFDLCRAAPETKIVYTGATGCDLEKLVDKKGRAYYPNLYFETSTITQDMVKEIGCERFLFGSGAPLRGITPALLRLRAAKLGAAARRAVVWGNAARLLGFAGPR